MHSGIVVELHNAPQPTLSHSYALNSVFRTAYSSLPASSKEFRKCVIPPYLTYLRHHYCYCSTTRALFNRVNSKMCTLSIYATICTLWHPNVPSILFASLDGVTPSCRHCFARHTTCQSRVGSRQKRSKKNTVRYNASIVRTHLPYRLRSLSRLAHLHILCLLALRFCGHPC